MAIFYSFSTFDESLAMLGDLAAAGFEILPDTLYESASARSFRAVDDDLVALLREGPGFYLRGDFTPHPVQFTRLASGAAVGQYVIDLMTQGPLLQGLCGRLNLVKGEPMLLLGDLSYQNEYRHPETGAWEKAGKEVKAAHRHAVATMKKRLVDDPAAGGFPISPQALELVRRGEARPRTSAVAPQRKA